MDFKDRLVLIRKANSLTQKQLASSLNLSEVSIQNYESGKRKPPFDTLVNMANYFDVSLDYLVGISDHKDRY